MEKRADVFTTFVSLLNRGATFAMYSLPGQDSLSFIVDDNKSPVVSSRKFTVVTWSGERYVIHDRVAPSAIDNLPFNDMSCRARQLEDCSTTSWEEYKAGVDRTIGLLRTTDGKVVISKQEIMRDAQLDMQTIARCVFEMFEQYVNAFCAVYYTPLTGFWCTCSPELLLEVDKKNGDMHTVALAGTRDSMSAGAWDSKNIMEHGYVVRYIAESLGAVGIEPRISDTGSITVGNIQHLLTRIDGVIDTVGITSRIDRIIDALHPTPAICGFTVDWSRKVIGSVERHDRQCYGGYYSLEDDDSFIAHVNLRCFAFDAGICCFWAGGGIMADSTPESEWMEATAKINTTRSFIEKVLSSPMRQSLPPSYSR